MFKFDNINRKKINIQNLRINWLEIVKFGYLFKNNKKKFTNSTCFFTN